MINALWLLLIVPLSASFGAIVMSLCGIAKLGETNETRPSSRLFILEDDDPEIGCLRCCHCGCTVFSGITADGDAVCANCRVITAVIAGGIDNGRS